VTRGKIAGVPVSLHWSLIAVGSLLALQLADGLLPNNHPGHSATTYWALAHGGSERNPLLAFRRIDVGMVKIIQFPLLAKAIDAVEARHPRLGRRLRWATLAFHAVLAVNNVRMGRTAGELGLGARRLAKP